MIWILAIAISILAVALAAFIHTIVEQWIDYEIKCRKK